MLVNLFLELVIKMAVVLSCHASKF
jgi:hypothetical protein